MNYHRKFGNISTNILFSFCCSLEQFKSFQLPNGRQRFDLPSRAHFILAINACKLPRHPRAIFHFNKQ